MRSTRVFSPLRWMSVIVILVALALIVLQLIAYSRVRTNFPPGMKIAGIPVGGLGRQETAQRLLEFFTLPLEIHYGDATFQLAPSTVGFELDLESMLAAADLERTQQSFWIGYWNYLWGLSASQRNVPLRANYSDQRLRSFLESEVATRYDKPPVPAKPAVGTVNFQAGSQGTVMDTKQAVILIEQALNSTSPRKVTLPLKQTSPPRPSLQNLQVLLQQTIDLSGYDGITGLYMLDLQTLQEIHFIYNQGKNLPINPDLSFTAASIIKIPIMTSIYRRIGDNPNPETINLLQEMIIESGNPAADWLMQQVISEARGPLEVTADMQTLGLQDTFLAGYFYPGAPLLVKYKTPGNTRTDITSDPDPYNQTSPSDIGSLLADIYECAENGGGSLIAAFPNEITQAECHTMISYLSMNPVAFLIKAGTPDGTQIAHKHGWVSDVFGVINVIQDAAIVFTPGGDYVLVILLHHPQQLIWEPSANLVADISRAIYNYYNLPQP